MVGAKVSIAMAVTGPMPGTRRRRAATALFSASSAIRSSSALIRSDKCAIWSR